MELWHRVASWRVNSVDLAECKNFVFAVVAIALVWIVFDRLGR